MKKLAYSDLTPEFLKEIEEQASPEAVVELCAKKGFEITEKGAARLLKQLENAKKLDDKELQKVAAGARPALGTLTSSAKAMLDDFPYKPCSCNKNLCSCDYDDWCSYDCDCFEYS